MVNFYQLKNNALKIAQKSKAEGISKEETFILIKKNTMLSDKSVNEILKYGYVDVIAELLKHDKIQVNLMDKKDFAALSLLKNHAAQLKFLLSSSHLAHSTLADNFSSLALI